MQNLLFIDVYSFKKRKGWFLLTLFFAPIYRLENFLPLRMQCKLLKPPVIRAIFVLGISMCITQVGVSQSTIAYNSLVGGKHDTNYIQSFYPKLTGRIFASERTNIFTLTDLVNSRALAYSPNRGMDFGLGMNYRWLGLSLSFTTPLNPEFKQTQKIDLQAGIFMRRYVFDLYFQSYTGMYLINASSLRANAVARNFQRPDVRSINFGSNAYYIFNRKRFSARAAFSQQEIQRKSAGSFLAGAFFNVHQIASDSSLVPGEFQSLFTPQLLGIDEALSINIGLQGGYTQTIVIAKHFFANLFVTLGAGTSTISRGIALNNRYNTQFSLKAQGRLALGYNTDKWFMSLIVSTDNVAYVASDTELFTTSSGIIRLSVGTRFDVKKIESKLGIKHYTKQ